MIGRKIHHYQITEKLGEGGMGVVYKAEDTKLHRTVALKFLNPALLDSPSEQQRLVNEARAAAGLSHPNICTIYEINEFEGETFIAMAYVEGSTLRDRVLSDHIEIHEALRYLIQIADGLKQSHARDIVHRDIKSANIMLNPAGQAIIMDFGLARRTGAPRKDERFSSGGTSAYMSPEQARGEGVDQRTDIWSLGVVLYEMIAGQLPFRADYEQAVIYSILNEAPRPISELRTGVSAQVIKIVDTCLAKEPDDRYQSLEDLIHELRAVLDHITGGSRPGTGRHAAAHSATRNPLGIAVAAVLTLVAAFLAYDFIRGQLAGSEVRIPIAVIDFNNETGEEAMDGLSGMLITALEQSRRLSVMTRTRMFDVLKGQGRDDVDRITESVGQEICRNANVGALVIPSIRKFGELYTIDLKVLDTRSNQYIFTTKEEGQGQESIPGMIDRIASDIRIDLRDETHDMESTLRVGDVTTVNLEAYQRYFEGENYLNDLDFKKAHEAFERAVALDSTFALAYYRLAYSEWWSRGQVEHAREHVGRAIDMIERIPEKERYLVRALEAGLNDGFAAQTPIYNEMRALYPNDKEMLFGLGDAEFHSMNYDSSIVHFSRVLEIDPEFDRALQHLTWAYYRTDRYEESEQLAERWVGVTGTAESYAHLAAAQRMLGNNDVVLATLDRADAAHPNDFMLRQQRAEYYLSNGQPEAAVKQLQSVMATDTTMLALKAAQMLAEQVYPHMGRFSDAMKLYSGVDALLAAGKVDSSVLAGSRLGMGSLVYWAHEDADRSLALIEGTLGFPEKYQSSDYWKGVAALYILTGHEDRALEIFDTKAGEMHPLEVQIYDVFRHSVAGRCDSAIAVVDSGMAGEDMSRAGGVIYTLVRCLVESGRYDEALERAQTMLKKDAQRLSFAAMVAPTYILVAEAYEGKGEAAKAIESYQKALDIWKDGDTDVPLRLRAQARLEALQSARSM